jgi:hypothetical protein
MSHWAAFSASRSALRAQSSMAPVPARWAGRTGDRSELRFETKMTRTLPTVDL